MKVKGVWRWIALVAAFDAAACTGSDVGMKSPQPNTSSSPVDPTSVGQTGTPTPMVSVMPSASTMGAAGSGHPDSMTLPPTRMPAQIAPGTGNGVPCDVASVISDSCTSCHSATPKFGAPMPLMKHADFMATAKSNPAKKVYEVVPDRIMTTDASKRMPPASSTALAAPVLARFNTWLTGGAKPDAMGCAITEKPATTVQPPTKPVRPGEGNMPTIGTRSGGATEYPQDYNDPLMKCYQFRAHAPGNKDEGFSVGTTPDLYTQFNFAAPWQGTVYGRSFRWLEGNNQVIHHWLLYKNTGTKDDGSVEEISVGAHPDGELLQGWAPGGSDAYYDPDVAQELPGDVSYTLETHHNNRTGAPALDNTGIEVCVTPTKPDKVVSLSWLGTDFISGTSASGTCTPTSKEPIHIIGFVPHMHKKGRHFTATITRANGMTETMHDADFDFGNQRAYFASITLMPGDNIKVTCTYSAPSQFGQGTNEEMCYMFTGYYPKLSLTNGNPVANVFHGPNTCLE